MEWAHGKRKVAPEFQQYAQTEYPAGDIANLAYDYTRKQTEAGDERSDWDLRTEFYKKVYPDLDGFLASRTPANNESPYAGLDAFLLGQDLESPKAI
jgi:hypothetical protein